MRRPLLRKWSWPLRQEAMTVADAMTVPEAMTVADAMPVADVMTGAVQASLATLLYDCGNDFAG